MDGFFEKYGRVIIIAVAICFVLLYLTPMRNVVGSSINGFAGNFANKVGESLGTVKMPDGSVAKEKSSMIIGSSGDIYDGSLDAQFANAIPKAATAVVFTDEVAPEGVSTTDLTVAKDGDVVGWLDGTTWKVSTQDPNKAVTFNENCIEMFAKGNLMNISFDNVDTSNVTDMSYMFAFYNGTKLDLSALNTSNVTNMSGMFHECRVLNDLNVSGWDTSNVTDMSVMFYGCPHIKKLDLSHFETSNVTNMMMMFSCDDIDVDRSELAELDLSGFDTSNVTDMNGMFSCCEKLETIYVGPKWTTKNVVQTEYNFNFHRDDDGAFARCYSLPNYKEATANSSSAHTGPGGYLTLKA